MRASSFLFSLMFLTVTLMINSTARADLSILDSVVTPGELIQGHAKLDKECKSCHKKFDKGAQDRLCMGCHEHKPVADDVRAKTGYHGKIGHQPCRACHTDHKGREKDIIGLDKKTFNHHLTDFDLTGKHKSPRIKCSDCHGKGQKYREAPSECYACHKKDDKHKGHFGKECAQCHTDGDWKQVKFDHSETRFPLGGKHVEVKCESCHEDPGYRVQPKTDCYSCHRKDDEHKGRFGSRCEQCHLDTGWTKVKFDHDRDTDFLLQGKHRPAKCESCHTKLEQAFKPAKTCYACHQKEDEHKGQQGKECQSCHNENSWKETRFDHGLSRFPLLGKHEPVKCNKCHTTKAFKDASSKCIDCHKDEDAHKARLGPVCETCHSARDWTQWYFDHDKQTNYPLDGSHKGITCVACHKTPVTRKITLSASCNSCHSKDDVHDGSYGQFCERCHVTRSFSRIKSRPGIFQ
ncbi:MAG: cytochrome C [Gammaproteobacteria bacterium]|nr:cytochrome C [Gammaproteobacteria bacterium]